MQGAERGADMTAAATDTRRRVGSRYGGIAWRSARSERDLPPAWRSFIDFCGSLEHGELERLKIQDGVPVLAELTRKKVKFP